MWTKWIKHVAQTPALRKRIATFFFSVYSHYLSSSRLLYFSTTCCMLLALFIHKNTPVNCAPCRFVLKMVVESKSNQSHECKCGLISSHNICCSSTRQYGDKKCHCLDTKMHALKTVKTKYVNVCLVCCVFFFYQFCCK